MYRRTESFKSREPEAWGCRLLFMLASLSLPDNRVHLNCFHTTFGPDLRAWCTQRSLKIDSWDCSIWLLAICLRTYDFSGRLAMRFRRWRKEPQHPRRVILRSNGRLDYRSCSDWIDSFTRFFLRISTGSTCFLSWVGKNYRAGSFTVNAELGETGQYTKDWAMYICRKHMT